MAIYCNHWRGFFALIHSIQPGTAHLECIQVAASTCQACDWHDKSGKIWFLRVGSGRTTQPLCIDQKLRLIFRLDEYEIEGVEEGYKIHIGGSYAPTFDMHSLLLVTPTLAVFGLYVYQLLKPRPLRKLRAPPCPSFLTGNQHQLAQREQIGDLEFKWTTEFGAAYRIAGCLGEDILVLSDPKALQHIVQGGGYQYPKTPAVIRLATMITGSGLVSTQGDVHQRQRRILNPAFSAQQIRAYLPIFQANAFKLLRRWSEELEGTGKTIDVHKPLASFALDVIGEAGFRYQFGSLDHGEGSDLAQAYDNLFIDVTLHPPKWDIVMQSFLRYIPSFIVSCMLYLPNHQYRRLRNFMRTSLSTAAGLLQTYVEDSTSTKYSADMLGLLAAAGISHGPTRRLESHEVHSQLGTMMVAGHETTSTSLTWLISELAHHPKVQDELRKEINDARTRSLSKARIEFSQQDFENMPLLNAIIKETLRFHAIVPSMHRCATTDDAIPLGFPVQGSDGSVLSEIVIPKGQAILIDIASYNRLPQLWGADAHQWNPYRFLQGIGLEAKSSSVGVYANLMSFSAGVRSCIGWRFALLEMQTVVTELIEKFRFSAPIPGIEMVRAPAITMQPMIRGKPEMGACMPLRVEPVEDVLV